MGVLSRLPLAVPLPCSLSGLPLAVRLLLSLSTACYDHQGDSSDYEQAEVSRGMSVDGEQAEASQGMSVDGEQAEVSRGMSVDGEQAEVSRGMSLEGEHGGTNPENGHGENSGEQQRAAYLIDTLISPIFIMGNRVLGNSPLIATISSHSSTVGC